MKLCACGCGVPVSDRRRYGRGHAATSRANLSRRHANDIPISEAAVLVERLRRFYGSLTLAARATGLSREQLSQWRRKVNPRITQRNYLRLLAAADGCHLRTRSNDDRGAEYQRKRRAKA